MRSGFHPLEEADKWPAMQQYMDIVKENVDDPKFAVLGMQSFSAWLLFTAAQRLRRVQRRRVLSRECVLKAADAIEEWTGGGLHGPTDPGPEGGPERRCGMLMTVNSDGEFERYLPGSEATPMTADGFSCHEDGGRGTGQRWARQDQPGPADLIDCDGRAHRDPRQGCIRGV